MGRQDGLRNLWGPVQNENVEALVQKLENFKRVTAELTTQVTHNEAGPGGRFKGMRGKVTTSVQREQQAQRPRMGMQV